MAIVDKIELAKFVANNYKKAHNYEISPVKLQKTMYFSFALWGGKIQKLQNSSGSNELVGSLDKYLFDASFEAWQYGPVDRQLYNFYKSGVFSANDAKDLTSLIADESIKGIVIPYINNILSQTFKIGDFTLVDISHDDEVWKAAYAAGEENMVSYTIINEYASR